MTLTRILELSSFSEMLSGFIVYRHRKLLGEQRHSLCEIVAVSVVHSVTHHGFCEDPQGAGLGPSPGKKTFIVKEFSCFSPFFFFFDLIMKKKVCFKF